MRSTAALAIPLFLSLASCGRRNDSLVGAEDLPSTTELSRETIQINRDRTVGRQNHYLTYELKPDNSLSVTHALDGYQGNQIVGAESFRLNPETAASAREKLSRLRPAQLQGVEYLIYPEGCEPPIDSGIEVAIAFIGKNDSIGIFALPYACKDGQAARARIAVAHLMELLPPSKVAQAFPQAT